MTTHPVSLYADECANVVHADWRELAELVRARGGCDALITDPPYSDRTHRAYAPETAIAEIPYQHWNAKDASEFVGVWSPLTRGWMAIMTDHVLGRAWEDALEAAGRYVFAPIPCVEMHSRPRVVGDGPPSWTVWLLVARPRTGVTTRWSSQEERARRGVPAIPGAYWVDSSSIMRERAHRIVGGKSLSMMRAIVRDYSSKDDVIVDPCCGSGTTLIAALDRGCRVIGGDANREHAEIAARRVRAHRSQMCLAF